MATNEQITNVLLGHVGRLESGDDAQASASKAFSEILAVRESLITTDQPSRRTRALTSEQGAALSTAINLARSPQTTRGQVERFLAAHGELDWTKQF